MSWIYHQRSGTFEHNQQRITGAYAGKLPWQNQPTEQDRVNQGPIPRGRYAIGGPVTHPRTGPFTLPLTAAASNQMFGRTGFLIHGPNRAHPLDSSEGCIVVPLAIRHQIWWSNDHQLEVQP